MRYPLIYRQALPTDVPEIWQARTESIRALCSGYYSAGDIEAWASAPMPGGFAELVHTRDFLVAEQRGAIVGFGFLHRQAAELEALFVAPRFARRGIGTALLRALETIARDAGLKSLKLSASLNSVEFYAAAGTSVGRFPATYKPAGRGSKTSIFGSCLTPISPGRTECSSIGGVSIAGSCLRLP